jgi:regulator of protease activity HflC (stomatin/prohibitin superfamily)
MPTFLTLFVIILALLFIDGLFTIPQQKVGVLQFFGKFSRTAKPGLNIKFPIFERVAGKVNLRVQQLDVNVETKTKDNVFVKVIVSVQYYVLPGKVYEAFYKLDSTSAQITSYVYDVVRSRVPKINLDDVFENKDDIAVAIKEELTEVMDEFGYGIVKALVTDIDPDKKVKDAMNEINAAQRQRVASTEKGEADKILKVKAAEADAESKALAGKGIADQRKAIVDGLKESVNDFQQSIPGTQPQEVMNLVLITQYFDTLKDIGTTQNKSTVFIPHTPGAMNSFSNEVRNAVMSGQMVQDQS